MCHTHGEYTLHQASGNSEDVTNTPGAVYKSLDNRSVQQMHRRTLGRIQEISWKGKR